MKIWSVSCALAAILLITQAQRRGSRRFDVSQESETSAEEEEPPLSRAHRFQGRRQTPEIDSSDRLTSRGRSRSRENDRPVDSSTEFTRRGSRQEETQTQSLNLRKQSNSRRSKELTFSSRGESSVVPKDSESTLRRSNYEGKSSGRRSEESRSQHFPPRFETDSSSHNSGSDASHSRSQSRFSSRGNTDRSRSQGDEINRSRVINERKPIFSVTSIVPEDVTFPSRSRTRQSSEESLTTQSRDNNIGSQRNTAEISRGQSKTKTTSTEVISSRKLSDTSSTRGSFRGRGAELDTQYTPQSTTRARNEFLTSRNKPPEPPKQDVEARVSSRRRPLDTGRTKPTTVADTDYLPSKVTDGSSVSDFEDKPNNLPPLVSSDTIMSPKSLEEEQTTSNDVLLSTDPQQTTVDVSEKIQTEPVSLNTDKEDILNKALHPRARGRGTGNLEKDTFEPSDRSPPRTSFRTRQKTKEPEIESNRFPGRNRNSRPEIRTASEIKEGLSPRSRSNIQQNRQSINEQNVQDIRNSFRSRNSNQPSSRLPKEPKEDPGHITEDVNRRHESFVTATQPSASASETEASPQSRGTFTPAGRRRTLTRPTEGSETSTKPSRGRGHVKQDGGKQNENERRSGSGKDEEVSEDDNYPDVYKQLKKAGNGPKEILALLMARKKQREAQRKQQTDLTTPPTALLPEVTSFAYDLKTEEDNIKPSIESPAKRRKSAGISLSEPDQTEADIKALRSSYRQRSIPLRSQSEDSNQLDQANEERPTRRFRPRSEIDSYQESKEENKRNYDSRKYSAKFRSGFNKEKDLDEEDKSEKPAKRDRFSFKSLNDLGLDPKTLETTEPVTERERFIPSSRRTKSYKSSTEGLEPEIQSTSTFKPRYQLYQAKNRKKLLEKRFGGKDSAATGETTEPKETEPEDDISEQRSKKLKFGAASRPPYTPPRKNTTPLPPSRPATARYSGRSRYRSSPLNLPTQLEDQEPVTVHILEVEVKAPKLESASLVTEATSTSSSVENTTITSSTSGISESPLENSVIDDEPVIPISPMPSTPTTPITEPSTTTSTTTTTKIAVTPTTTSTPSSTTTTTQSPTSTSTQKSTTTKKPTTQKPTSTQKPTTKKPIQPKSIATQKSTTTTKKPTTTTTTTTTQRSTTPTQTTTTKPTTSLTPTSNPSPTNKRESTTTKKPIVTTTTKKPITTTKKPTTKKPNTTKKPPSVPKPLQQQISLSTAPTTTTTAATTPAQERLSARSNFLERSAVSTVPEMIITAAQTFQPSTFGNIPRSTEPPQTQSSADFVAYALLPNNTLVRRVTARSTTPPTEIPFVVYGLYPNGTIVRRYPNGTVVPDDPMPESNELVAEVDPLNRQELSNILERDRPFAYTTTTTTTTMAPVFFSSTETTPTSSLSTIMTTVTTTTAKPTTITTTSKKPSTTTMPSTTTKKLITTTIKPVVTSTKKPTTTKPISTTTTTPSTTTTSTTTTVTPPTTTTTTTSRPTTLPTTARPITTNTTAKPTTTTTARTTPPTTARPTTTTTTTARPTTTTTTRKPTTTTTTRKPTTTTARPTTTTTTAKPTTKKPITTTKKPTTTPKPITTTKPPTTSNPITSTTSTTIEPSTRVAEETTLPSPKSVTPPGALSDDFALLNSLLRLQGDSSLESNRIAPSESPSDLPVSGPDDDDIANRIIQLAIERAQSSTESSPSTEGVDLQQLSSSPQPTFERESKSIAPPLVDSMGVESSSKPGGKISLWVVPETETEQTTKAQKLTPEEEQVLTALLAAPQSTTSVSLRDQLLLAELLNAGAGNNGAAISTTKRPRKKKRPTTRAPPPPPTLSPLAALFGGGGGGGGLFGSGAVPGGTGVEGEEGEATDNYARPQGGLLVNAAINITRAVSQFMGLVLQGAAQSFQSFLASRTRNFAEYFARGGAIS